MRAHESVEHINIVNLVNRAPYVKSVQVRHGHHKYLRVHEHHEIWQQFIQVKNMGSRGFSEENRILRIRGYIGDTLAARVA